MIVRSSRSRWGWIDKRFLGGLFLLVFLLGVLLFVNFGLPRLFRVKYDPSLLRAISGDTRSVADVFVATHLDTPPIVKALYMTSWVAGNKSRRDELVRLIDETELNAVVIDIKDYTGKIAFPIEDLFLKKISTVENRIPDVKEFIADLHERGIYVIGRISVFQDPELVKKRPELAVKRRSDGKIWRDYKGISWLDAGAPQVWRYASVLGEESYRFGFDEINFDYIRFPSDGNMADIAYPASEGRIKAEVIRDFFAYLDQHLKLKGPTLSADLFGMTTTNTDDLNIGQVLENALPYFDYVAPMVYPSHYPPTFLGFSNPAEKPYEVIRFSLESAFERASTTPWKIRPWLQDFDLGATYTSEMVRKEIQAVYDSGLDSWMLWSASNRYTKDALLIE